MLKLFFSTALFSLLVAGCKTPGAPPSEAEKRQQAEQGRQADWKAATGGAWDGGESGFESDKAKRSPYPHNGFDWGPPP